MKKATKVTKSSDVKSTAKKKVCTAQKECVAKPAKKPATKTKAAATSKVSPASSKKEKATKKLTRIIAHINVGWGNMLYIRGEGAGLSWEQGVPMLCHDGSEWHWIAETEEGPISFKFLINDEKWALGENVTINAGDTHLSEPSF